MSTSRFSESYLKARNDLQNKIAEIREQSPEKALIPNKRILWNWRKMAPHFSTKEETTIEILKEMYDPEWSAYISEVDILQGK